LSKENRMHNADQVEKALHREQVKEVRPFFLLVVVVLGGVFSFIVWSTPSYQRLPILLPASALMLLHLGMHWVLPATFWIQPTVPGGLRYTLLYVAAQLLIILGITYFVPHEGVLYGLYLALIGEVIGVFGSLRKSVLPILVVLIVGLLNVVWALGFERLPSQVLVLAPMLLFTAIYVSLFNRQMEARQEAHELVEELQKANTQLEAYADQVEALTLQNERQRMARELHDTLAQGLVGVILQLETVDVQLAKGHSEEAQELVQRSMERARMTLAEARQAISDLRAEIADLQAVIDGVVRRFQNATGIACEVTMDDLGGIPPELADHLVRACSEGLSNITRHAHASRVRLELLRKEDRITLRLADDGIGFSTAALEGKTGHYGLVGLRERARLAGGTFDVASDPAGQGTVLTFSLPLDREDFYG